MEHFRFSPDVEKQLVFMLLKFYQNLEKNPQNPATLYRKRQKNELLGFCQLVFLFQQSEQSVVENGRNFAAGVDFLVAIFILEIQNCFVHETNCCSFSLQTLIRVVNMGQKIH